MGVFKWLRRERVTVTTRHVSPEPTTHDEQQPQSATQVGTIRTDEYKRDLAEFQARRSSGTKELPDTPVKKKCGRHSLPVSCTDCAASPDNTFNYEKKSAIKYKKKSHKRARSATSDEKVYDAVPNIQFLFQNQVFMPGNLFPSASYTEPQRSKRHSRRACRSPEMNFIVQKHIDFDNADQDSPPMFYKNNSLPFDTKNFLDLSRTDEEEVDGTKAAGDVKVSSQSTTGERKDDSCDDKLWEVMSELKNFDQWADEQLQFQSPNMSKSDDNKSDTSVYGLPVASASNLNVSMDKEKSWNHGTWGVVPVQTKKLNGVTIEHVKKKRNSEINMLRKCRHPNIILLMGVYPDFHNNVHLICERCVDSLHGVLHEQGRILTAQTSVQYALDVANALVFLRMHGYIHTALNSSSIMVTSHDSAKLADLGPCLKLSRKKEKTDKGYEVYSPEPQYVNIEDSRDNTQESEPLISKRSSETYISANAVCKEYSKCREAEMYRWQAPELFEPDDGGAVYACSKSDVYSLCLVLWECCNAAVPWKTLTYEKLKELYTLWQTGIRLPQDGTYPGSLLSVLQEGLKLQRRERLDLATLQTNLQNVKRDLDGMEYIIIPARLSKKKSTFSSVAWDTLSPTDSETQSPISKDIHHKAIVHDNRDSSTDTSEKESKSASPLYETIRRSDVTYAVPEKAFISDEEEDKLLKYEHLPEKDYSSACSTPIAKIRARIKDIGTPGVLHRSDSTEYCSILSPNRTVNFGLNNISNRDQSGERPTTKLSRSFTPKSYTPLHIKVPEFNLESIKPLLKDQQGNDRSSYNFDIKNYSLPSTPIARSNKLRKNAWLSGDLSLTERSMEKIKDVKTPNKEGSKQVLSAPETPVVSTYSSLDKEQDYSAKQSDVTEGLSPESVDATRDSFTGLRRIDPPHDFHSLETENARERTNSWSYKSSPNRTDSKCKVEEELAGLSVKPLVAIHERWIYEANRKTGRSMSLPENQNSQISAVKPASHCVDTLQKSLPQLNVKRPAAKTFRACPSSPNSGKSGGSWDQFCTARETIAKNMIFSARDPQKFNTWKKDSDKSTVTEDTERPKSELKIDQATDTRSIEEFIRDLIRKEFQYLLHEISDDASSCTPVRNEELLNKGVANILETLKNDDIEQTAKKEPIKSFSRVKINGNNKPLLQITFSRSGENSLQVLDNCVNVTICDNNTSGREKLNVSVEDTLVGDDIQINSLKRCQAFNAIQEARSTEDLYIDDDLSTQMQENFGGKVKLIPLHGSLHEILCEKEDDCCLIKVKQENGCDTIYFRCDNSDTESRDAIDGCAHDNRPQDTVVYKRSISLIEERIQRVFPKEKRAVTPVTVRKKCTVEKDVKARPKSEVFMQNICKESRVLSNSSPSLVMNDKSDEVEVNIENVMCYQDSSSEECLKCQAESDDFELLERKIEEDMANNLSSMTCGCLEKISEENLSALNDDVTEK